MLFWSNVTKLNLVTKIVNKVGNIPSDFITMRYEYNELTKNPK